MRLIKIKKKKKPTLNVNVILPLYKSFIKPHLEYAVHFSSPHHAKDVAKLGVQRRAA